MQQSGQGTRAGDDQALMDALAAREGLVCFIGAGGKKTTLYRLARAHPGRVGVTTTVHLPYFPVELGAAEVIEVPHALVAAVVAVARDERLVAFAQPSEKRGRWAGVAPDILDQVRRDAGLDVLLVKADGARSRLIKASSDKEPPLPKELTTVVRVLSVRAVGLRLSEGIAHRVERISALTGLAPGDVISAEHLVRLLRTEAASTLSQISPGSHLIAQLNMVDDPADERVARQVAEALLDADAGYERVVLTRATHPRPLIAVVVR
jgi:probable selenium-dependent hydroxylase accessory protein YqeC